jgi:hypothetical protein
MFGKMNRKIVMDFISGQLRAWSCYYIWRNYSIQDIYTGTGLLEFIAFLFVTEIFYQSAKRIFIQQGKL